MRLNLMGRSSVIDITRGQRLIRNMLQGQFHSRLGSYRGYLQFRVEIRHAVTFACACEIEIRCNVACHMPTVFCYDSVCKCSETRPFVQTDGPIRLCVPRAFWIGVLFVCLPPEQQDELPHGVAAMRSIISSIMFRRRGGWGSPCYCGGALPPGHVTPKPCRCPTM